MFSVLVLTLNEEENLPGCLESVSWCEDVVVYDSYSADQTVQIAKEQGARVEQREFDNYASQRNAALQSVEYEHPWVLMVDADERVSEDLRAEIREVLPTVSEATTMFRMRRKDFLMGRWLKRSSGYPTWFGRLVRPNQVEVKRKINEEYHAQGEVRDLRSHLLHYPFNRGIGHWVERHNEYSRMEAESLIEGSQEPIKWGALLGSDPVERRRTLKNIAYRLPFRPFIVFLYLYIFRLGLLDGKPGLTFAMLRSIYEYLIDIKVKELRRRRKGLPV